jgi:hypothetical protein
MFVVKWFEIIILEVDPGMHIQVICVSFGHILKDGVFYLFKNLRSR